MAAAGTNRWETPLAERMRPATLAEFAGQRHLLGEGAPLGNLLRSGRPPSCILYGPPGVGKTTLVRLMASATGRDLLEINAVSAKVSELRDLVAEASRLKAMRGGRSAMAFVDEIYHFNKSQQNALLPSVEKGELILIGTTTENPWFEINKTLLSRMVVFQLEPLSEEELAALLKRAAEDRERGLGDLEVAVTDDAFRSIAAMAGGDARQALTRLELAAASVAARGGAEMTEEDAAKALPLAAVRYDKASDDHYAIISAFIKSIRGSDPDAAVYWLARLLAGGENLRFICRRLLISAAEDIGLADPFALTMAASAAHAVEMTGMPEARIILAEAVIYLASAPKSNSAYLAVDGAAEAIKKGDLQEVPDHLKPGGTGYLYPHDYPRRWAPQKYMEGRRRFYFPGALGDEAEMAERLSRFWRRFRDGQE
ncbi:MAG: replication-associated recombination protein A [Synergistaceae bacterium]|nr:replication-associated recombination protein A [Synergistaceae bacterium]